MKIRNMRNRSACKWCWCSIVLLAAVGVGGNDLRGDDVGGDKGVVRDNEDGSNAEALPVKY